MIEINKQQINLIEYNWKTCIILDACRYDIFKEYLDLLPEGQLTEAYTHCRGTQDWMQQNLQNQDCNDIIYIDPIVMFNQFLPEHNFYKIIPAWKTHWNYDYGTILPEDMTQLALEHIKHHPDKRFLIHYHQPHPPYLIPEFIDIAEPDTPEKIQKIADNHHKKFNTTQFIQGNMRRFLGSRTAWNWMKHLHLTPTDYAGKIYKRYGWDGLIDGYQYTLHKTLMALQPLYKKQHTPIVITSDHSKNIDGSQRNLQQQPVPWMEITL